jgi:uncharacterized protein (DUF2267 family)
MNLREDRSSKRHHSHADTSYAHLIHRVQEATGLKNREKAEVALLVSLEGLLRGIPAADAMRILAQLPLIVRDELRTFAVGPDKDVNASAMKSELQSHLQLGEGEATATLSSICNLLANSLSSSLVTAFRTNLPADMKGLFPISRD